ncbi:hypothetical protein [Legionella tucsonensis]|uniref:hypothetical protein n=1 Tax=Legionella tucsonensis TaxID=40335 RepID=UPI000B11FA10|nr:hypothetical protein [Legionella tucsonensis]
MPASLDGEKKNASFVSNHQQQAQIVLALMGKIRNLFAVAVGALHQPRTTATNSIPE